MTFTNKNKILLLLVMFFIAILSSIYYQSSREFDIRDLDSRNVMKHVEILTSEPFSGRLTGSEGNEKALAYIESYFEEIGLVPAGENDSWYQDFSVLVPSIDPSAEFKLVDSEGEMLESFKMYRDYSAVFSPKGGPINFSGEYIMLGADFLRVDPTLLEGKIAVIEFAQINSRIVNYVMDSGGKGVLCSTDSSPFAFVREHERTQAMDISGKGGPSIFLGYISKDTYKLLQTAEGAKISINVGATFPIVETSNILGMIQGTAKDGGTLILSAGLDSLGSGTDNQYFPGAINSATGVGILLETARIMRNAESLPYETVIFAMWNGQNQHNAGVEYFLSNPTVSLDRLQVIHLGAIGKETQDGLSLVPDPLNGTLMADLMEKYGLDSSLSVKGTYGGGELATLFSNEKVPSVMLNDSERTQNNYDDSYEAVQVETVENAAKVLLTYLKREIYNDHKIDYLKINERVIAFGILLVGGFILAIGALYKFYPTLKVGKTTLEDFYYSTVYMGIRNLYTGILPYFAVVFLLAILVNIDPDANRVQVNGKSIVNFSWYLIIKDSLMYIRNLFNFELYYSETVGNVFRVILDSSKQSILLITFSLFISTIFGILRGMIEAYRSRKSSIGSLGTLVFFSIPDILIVLVILLSYTRLVVAYPSIKELEVFKDFILPLVALTIVPTVYISRITFIAIQEELVKDYIKNEKAKGFSRRKIIFVELIPAILFKIVDAMPAVMTMLLSNMIVIEYLFNYKGILYFLVYLYNRQDVFRFVPLALTLGLIYVVFTGGFKVAAKIINPLKRKGD